MSKVLFSLSNGVDGEIQLRDNDFVEFWKFVFKRNQKLLGVRRDKPVEQRHFIYDTSNEKQYWNTFNINVEKRWTDTIDIRQDFVNKINTSIDAIKSSGFNWQGGYINMNSKNEDCNRIHRCFTTFHLTKTTDTLNLSDDQKREIKYKMANLNQSDAWYYIKYLDPTLVNVFDNHDLFSKYMTIEDDLHTINAYVHRIEDHGILSKNTWTVMKQFLEMQSSTSMFLPALDWNSKGQDGCTDSLRIDFNFSDMRSQDLTMYSSDDAYNVYDLKNILGKDYETAWYNNDDPREWDVCNSFNTTKGGFEVRPYQSLLTKNYIKPWVDSYNFPSDDHIISPIAIGSIDQDWLREHCYSNIADDLSNKNSLTISAVDLVN
tara:strand:- start:79 stop:1203 length:1125 start_codon:yes stop_codon:yes gene_type:complete